MPLCHGEILSRAASQLCTVHSDRFFIKSGVCYYEFSKKIPGAICMTVFAPNFSDILILFPPWGVDFADTLLTDCNDTFKVLNLFLLNQNLWLFQ